MRGRRIALECRPPKVGAVVILAAVVLIASRLLAQVQIPPEHQPLADFEASSGRVEPNAAQATLVRVVAEVQVFSQVVKW